MHLSCHLRYRVLLLLPLALVVVESCDDADPTHERAVEELGPEDPSVKPSELHRPGQPCSVCHGGIGPAKSTFLLAGTIYATPDGGQALPGANVRFIDWVGAQGSSTTNCAGNFFVRADQADKFKWPMWMRVEQNGTVADMRSAVFREGSCNTCHKATATARNTLPVYLSEQPVRLLAEGCP